MARTAVQEVIHAIKASADQPGLYVTYSAIAGGIIVCLAVISSVIESSEKSNRSCRQRRMAELTNVLGAPAVVLAAVFWKVYSQIATRRLLNSIADPATRNLLTDVLYLLRCVDDFQHTLQTDIDARIKINRALLRGALTSFFQPSQITLKTSRVENFAQLTASAAIKLRLQRERKGSSSWLVAIPLFLVAIADHMGSAIILMSALTSLMAIKLREIVYDVAPISIPGSNRVCEQLATTWLPKVDSLHLTDLLALKNQHEVHSTRSTERELQLLVSHVSDSEYIIGQLVDRNLESYTIQYNLLKFLSNLTGHGPISVLSDDQVDTFRAQLTIRPWAWFATWMLSQRTVDIVFFCLLNSLVKAPATDAPGLEILCMCWYFFSISQWLDLGIRRNSHISLRVEVLACNVIATMYATAIILVHIIDRLTFYLRLFGNQFDSQQKSEPEDLLSTWLLPMIVMYITHTIGFLVLWWNMYALAENLPSKSGVISILTERWSGMVRDLFYLVAPNSFWQKYIRSESDSSRQDQNHVDFRGATMQAAQAQSEVQSQYHNVTWQCACGATLSDVYYETVPGSLRVLQQRLEEECMDVRDQDSSGFRSFALTVPFKSASRHSSGTLASPDSNKLGSTSTQNSNLVGSDRKTSANNELDTDPSLIPLSASTSAGTKLHLGVPKISYLLLCLPEAWAGVKLHHQQLVMTSAKNDFELFRLLRQVYGSKRSVLASMLSLRTVINISFAHFLVDLSHYVDLKPHSSTCQPAPQDCKCLPPQDMLVPATNAEYWCHPTQPEYVPPIGPNYLTHCFQNPGCVNRQSDWVLNQVPKRVSGQLMALSGSRPARGWGLAFEEGWDRAKIRNGLFGSVILGSFIFGILWSVFKKDIQSAYGVSAYVVSVLAIIGAYLGSAEPRLVPH